MVAAIEKSWQVHVEEVVELLAQTAIRIAFIASAILMGAISFPVWSHSVTILLTGFVATWWAAHFYSAGSV